jgi:hypothetical protein
MGAPAIILSYRRVAVQAVFVRSASRLSANYFPGQGQGGEVGGVRGRVVQVGGTSGRTFFWSGLGLGLGSDHRVFSGRGRVGCGN